MRLAAALACAFALPLAACSGLQFPWASERAPARPSARVAAPSPSPGAPPSADLPLPPPMPAPVAPGAPALPPVDLPADGPSATAPAPEAPFPHAPAAALPPWSADADPDLPFLPPETNVAAPRPWSVIVVHHSATARGGAALFDEWHRQKGWDGVGYDFVIGNGSDTPDGGVEVTFRWREQRDGAHAKGWNDVSVGICLVGNFETADPTPAQRETLVRLLRHLRRRLGVPAERIVGHKVLNPTLCPGRRLDLPRIVLESDPAAASVRRP